MWCAILIQVSQFSLNVHRDMHSRVFVPSLAILGGGVRGSLTSEGPERSSEAGSTLLALGHYPRDPTFCSGQAVATAAIWVDGRAALLWRRRLDRCCVV